MISKKWSLLVINALGNHKVLRYKELMSELGGVSPKSLADTLTRLCDEKLIRKESFAEIPARVQYSLTEEGRKLRTAMQPLLRWAMARHSGSSTRCVPRYRKAKAHILAVGNRASSNRDAGMCDLRG